MSPYRECALASIGTQEIWYGKPSYKEFYETYSKALPRVQLGPPFRYAYVWAGYSVFFCKPEKAAYKFVPRDKS